MSEKSERAECVNCPHYLHSPFGSLEPNELPIVDEHKICRRYRRGEVLYSEGEDSAGLYCLHSGKVKLQKLDEQGHEQILRLVRPGDAFGFRGLIDGGVHNSSAVALEDCDACYIPRNVFFSLLSERPPFALRIFEILTTELEESENRIVEMAHKPLRERVAEALVMVHHTYGERDDGSLNVRLTREDLASIVGSATESVIRTLSVLRDEGLIELDGRNIRLLDFKAVVRTANVRD
jgi:CRP/FNR family transcriptional regulator